MRHFHSSLKSSINSFLWFLHFFPLYCCLPCTHHNMCVLNCGMYVTNIIFDGILEMSNLRSLLKGLLHVDDDDDDQMFGCFYISVYCRVISFTRNHIIIKLKPLHTQCICLLCAVNAFTMPAINSKNSSFFFFFISSLSHHNQ